MNKVLNFILIFLALTAVSCSKPGNSSGGVKLSFEPETAEYTTGSCFVRFTVEGNWTISMLSSDGGGQPATWARFVTVDGRVSSFSGSGNGENVAVIEYDINDSTAVRNAVVTLTTSRGATTSKFFSQNGKPGLVTAVPKWLELPEQTVEYPYHNHFFSMNGHRYRNYSFSWDASSRLSRWVAYPLNSFYSTKKVDRTNAWAFDDAVPQSQQPNLIGSYSGKEYDRGHQLPSADRLCCFEANAQTFYFTNMTPQYDEFNQGVWGEVVENAVRGWGNSSDTLYVVTGCVMGSGRSTSDRSGNSCPIPKAYYKAVLRYNHASTQGWNGYTGIGIYLDHFSSYSSSSLTSDMVMSLADLEKRTGLRLFVNLDSLIGKETALKVKSQNPKDVKFWGIK